MKTQGYIKGRAPTKVNGQQLIFELKHKVVVALNKLADRDTYQIGFDELEKTAECIAPDMIPPFLSCLLDTDSEQKSSVRKECIRLMGTLVKFHEGLIRPHLRRMVGSLVKRLKDPDSAVRDACVETCGILSSKLINVGDESDEEVFVLLVKPIFEALGEQNRQVQSGSAFCLARIIDNTHDPPVSILQRMLARTTKLLKNPHFMAKPAVIDLNRSIIQAGGASNRNILSAAMLGIQEALKSSDWTTRKAASVALGDIAANCGSFLGSFKASCIRSLESCRFDKVKPVRDIVLQTLQYWNNIQGPDTPEPSETGSSFKENLCGGEFSDVSSAIEHGQKDVAIRKVGMGSTRGRVPLNMRKTCQSYMENTQHFKANNYPIEIVVPQKHSLSLAGFHTEESEDSSMTKTFQRVSTDATNMQDIEYDYIRMDDKQECSSVSSFLPGQEFVTVCDSLEDGSILKATDKNKQFVTQGVNDEGKIYAKKLKDRRSLDSVVTESSSQIERGCGSQMADDMICIRKHLLEIENKQSNLMDLFKEFTSGIMDSLSVIQSRVVGLEHVVYGLSQDLSHGGRHSDLSSSKFVKQTQNLTSPRLSTCTPRPSVDIHNRQSSLLSLKHSSIWDENVPVRSRLSNAAKHGTDAWKKTNTVNNPSEKDLKKYCGEGTQSSSGRHLLKTNVIFSSSPSVNVRHFSDGTNSIWKRVNGFLCQGDLDAAYVEALCSGDELVLFELLDRTGPVLECLSPKNISNILSILASFLPEQRFIRCIIPWFQQIVDLSTTHGANFLGLSAKERQEFVLAIQEASKNEFSNPSETRLITQLATKLRYLWGQSS